MKSRTESLQLAKHRMFDLLVIGGGIAGVGVAQNAARRGLSVMLVEKDDFASGTSSRTTKLIHGGLRYLEQFRLGLTRQLCQERGRLEKLAPHLIKDFSFVLPLSKKHPLFNWKAHLGLAMYDLVALSSNVRHHFQSLNAQGVLQSAPALSSHDLAGGIRFHDCITDDARIVLAVLKSACQYGAVAANYLQAKSFVTQGSQISGVNCRDRYSGEEFIIRCKAVVNATGVWTDEVCRMADPRWSSRIAPSKGIHIIVPASAFETNTALFLPTNDDRYVFVVPWQHALMIGTTDTAYNGDINNPMPNADEIDYLLHVVNSYSDTHKLNRSDITGSFAGLRPLVRFDSTAEPTVSGTGTAGMSREHLIFETAGGLINVAGGKLTSYRLMAEEVVHKVVAQVADVAAKPANTDTLMLGGWKHKQDFLTQSAEITALGRKVGLDPATIDHLVSAYGADAIVIMGLIERDSSLSERVCPDYTPILAEVIFTVQHEMAGCLEDVLFRRMRLGILNQKQTLEAAPKVAKIMQQLLDWDKRRFDVEMSTVETQVREHMQPMLEAVASA
ncbi:MAG TPA: glycerol-3-phosphate dehydrogenase/oxidase [Candidatus Obscuribacterales bacterium]